MFLCPTDPWANPCLTSRPLCAICILSGSASKGVGAGMGQLILDTARLLAERVRQEPLVGAQTRAKVVQGRQKGGASRSQSEKKGAVTRKLSPQESVRTCKLSLINALAVRGRGPFERSTDSSKGYSIPCQ